MNISILASHNGSVLQAVIDACNQARIQGRVACVISNNSQCFALQRAQTAGISTAHLSGATHPSQDALDAAILQELRGADTDLVVLCGYMKRLGQSTLSYYKDRILNTHPALLPRHGGQGFYGRRVHEAVIKSGDLYSGATVHKVDEHYDTGEIVAQAKLKLASDETASSLEERVQTIERELLINFLAKLAVNFHAGNNLYDIPPSQQA